MTKPTEYPLEWVRGTTTPLVFAIRRSGVPVPFDDVRLSVFKKDGKTLVFRATYSDSGGITVVNPATGLMKFQPTPEQTRALVKSKDGVTPQNIYELEYWDSGSQEVYLMGTVLAVGGINDDEDDAS